MLNSYRYQGYRHATSQFRCICIYAYNYRDGVGDAVAAFRVAKELHKLKIKNLLPPIVGIIELEHGTKIKAIKRLLEGHIKYFDKIFLISTDQKLLDTALDWPPNVIPMPQWIVIYGSNLDIINYVSSAEAFFKIYYNESSTQVDKHFQNCLPYNSKRITITELGLQDRDNTAFRLNLDTGGIWIDKHPEENLDLRAQRLLSFNNQEYIKMLLNTPAPTQKLAQQYLQNTHFMPGHVQNTRQALFFVMSHVLKYCDAKGTLITSCDFHLPKGMVDQSLFEWAMVQSGLSKVKLKFFDPNNIQISPNQTENKKEPKVRIISGYFLDIEDYESLYLISNDGAACSGDNSFLQVMSSHHPVFITGFGVLNQSIGNHVAIGNSFVKHFALRSFKQLMEKYTLREYATTMLAGANFETMNPFYRGETNQYDSLILKQAKEIAIVMKDPDFKRKWKAFREVVHQHYNFSDAFQAIVYTMFKIRIEPKPKPSL